MNIDNQTFFDLPEKEWREYMGTTSMYFYGLKLQQTPLAILKINHALNKLKPARIIEIGAGDGGLSYLLGLYSRIKGVPFHSYDIHDKGANIKELREVTDGFEVKDVLFDEKNVSEVAKLIQQDGLTLCILDAGKIPDFNIYAKHLKVGDYVMIHDFAPDKDFFETHIKGRVWNWLECTYGDIKEEAEKNNIKFFSYMNDCVWALGVKEK